MRNAEDRLSNPSENLSSSLQESRVFPPPEDFAAKAHVKSLDEYERMYRQERGRAGGVLGGGGGGAGVV